MKCNGKFTGVKDIMLGNAKKIIFTILSQGLILGLSVISGFILPEKMGPENFGYWQIYLFYLAYVNLFGLGFNDGIALFYAGYDYKKLPFQKLRSSMRIVYAYLAIVCVVGIGLVSIFAKDGIYQSIYTALVINIPLTCIQCIVFNVFLSVGKSEIYNILNLILKVLTVGLYLCMLFMQKVDPMSMVVVDTFARFVITVVCIYLGREFLFGKCDGFKVGWNELFEKCKSGLMITIAVISSMLMPMLGRYVVELYEPIATYGIFSFSMSLLSIILSFTSVVGTVLFPLLKRMQTDAMTECYFDFSFISDTFVTLALYMYLPLLFIIQNIMQKYIPALDYLYILLAMCIPLGRMQLLVMPYYKANRMEKELLYANLIGVVAMIGTLFSAYAIFKSVNVVAIGTTSVMVVWTFIAELFLHKKGELKQVYKQTIAEIFIIITFCVAGSMKSYVPFLIIYTISVLVYFVCRKNNIIALKKYIKTR